MSWIQANVTVCIISCWIRLTSKGEHVSRLQAIICDIKPSTKPSSHEQALDNLFGGEQSSVVCEKLVLVIDNFEVLAAHCKQVSDARGDYHEVMESVVSMCQTKTPRSGVARSCNTWCM